MKTYQTKIIPPRLRGAVPRERLFRFLDELSDCPVTWVSSPAGSGKTTLVASYTQARGIPTLWYRVDEADGDVASFFYYMREAAKGLKKGQNKPLPLFTPEYRLGIAAFTRHYFESLFRRMSIPASFVLDNYQDAPENSEFHEVIRNGLKVIPEGIRVFVVSRKEFPPSFVSLKAESLLTYLDWEHVRFNLDEVRDMISQRRKVTAPEEVVRRIHERTQGWAAAVILMLDGKEVPSVATDSIGQSSIFNYFSVEVFHRLDQRTKDFLLMTALLPVVSAEVASQLTGVEESDSILADLSRNHYFTEVYGTEYHYHPLFKEFLLDMAKRTYTADQLMSIHIKAAGLLAQAGHTEEAIRLFLDAGAYAQAIPLILGHAPTLLSHGRNATLEEWAGRIPEEMIVATPWLSYWLGMGRLIVDPTESRSFLEKAFGAFKSQADQVGCLLSVAGIMNSILLECDDNEPLDQWIEWLDRNVDPGKPLPSPEMEAHIASIMVASLTYRMPWHSKMTTWINRAITASGQVEDPLVRWMAKGHVMQHYASTGNFNEMRLLAEEFRQIAFSQQASPLVHLAYMGRIVQLHDWVHGSWEETLRRVQRAILMAEDLGAHFHLGMIYWSGVIAAFEMDNLELAGDFLTKIEQTTAIGKRAVAARCHTMRALYDLKRGDLVSAHQSAENAVKTSREAGIHIVEAYARVTFAYILRRLGEREKASDQLKRAEKMLEPLGITHPLYLIRLTQAGLLLDQNDVNGGRRALQDAFRMGREKGYAMTLYWFWQPDEMSRLCAEALSNGIELEYARELIRRHGLIPNFRIEKLREWPWAYRIHTLGRFEIVVNNEPLSFTGKVQKRPLALLKALISLGGREVREEKIEDLIWEEADGDFAHIAFKTTLSRLRRLLGSEETIEVKEGRVSLNARAVWLDTWVLESLAERVSELWGDRRQLKSVDDEVKELGSLVIDLYRGEFLAGDDEFWIGPWRDRLRKRFLRTIEKLGDMLKEAGADEKAISLYEHAIDAGLSPKDFHGRLPTSH